MSDNSAIEWTDATWNPVTGCTKVSPGCDHCYAERIVERFKGKGAFENVTLNEERLEAPLRWRKPRRVFVNSMSDLFHEQVPDRFVAEVFAVMALAARHQFQVLTKRHGRMRWLLNRPEFAADVYVRVAQRGGVPLADPWWPLPNVWLGVSVENQRWANIRVPALLDTPAAVRFLSCEPLLGPVNLDRWLTWPDGSIRISDGPVGGLDWVIVGGESGPGARPMHPDWARSLRDQCVAASVPFFYKQTGEWAPDADNYSVANGRRLKHDRVFLRPDGSRAVLGDDRGPGTCLDRVGKHAAGRELDGRTWDEYPEAARV